MPITNWLINKNDRVQLKAARWTIEGLEARTNTEGTNV